MDAIVNPQNSSAKAVMDNLAKRGEALVNAPAAIAEIYKKEGTAGVGVAVAQGLGHLVTDTGEAMGDVVYSASHLEEAGAKEKLASRSVDVVLGVADIVTIFDGAGAAKNSATGAMAVAKDMAAATKGGNAALATAQGVVVTTGKAAAAVGKPAEVLGQGAKAGAIMMMESKNLGSSGTTTGSGAGPSPPPVKKVPPGPRPPDGPTARPKGGAPMSESDAAALADRGMTARAAFPRSPLHHVFPQAKKLQEWIASRGVNIHEYVVELSEGEHSAVHAKGVNWNDAWKDFMASNPNATEQQIFEHAGKLMDKYKISGAPITNYTR